MPAPGLSAALACATASAASVRRPSLCNGRSAPTPPLLPRRTWGRAKPAPLADWVKPDAARFSSGSAAAQCNAHWDASSLSCSTKRANHAEYKSRCTRLPSANTCHRWDSGFFTHSPVSWLTCDSRVVRVANSTTEAPALAALRFSIATNRDGARRFTLRPKFLWKLETADRPVPVGHAWAERLQRSIRVRHGGDGAWPEVQADDASTDRQPLLARRQPLLHQLGVPERLAAHAAAQDADILGPARQRLLLPTVAVARIAQERQNEAVPQHDGFFVLPAQADHHVAFSLDRVQAVLDLEAGAPPLAEGVHLHRLEGAQGRGLRVVAAEVLADPASVPARLGVFLDRRRREPEAQNITALNSAVRSLLLGRLQAACQSLDWRIRARRFSASSRQAL